MRWRSSPLQELCYIKSRVLIAREWNLFKHPENKIKTIKKSAGSHRHFGLLKRAISSSPPSCIFYRRVSRWVMFNFNITCFYLCCHLIWSSRERWKERRSLSVQTVDDLAYSGQSRPVSSIIYQKICSLLHSQRRRRCKRVLTYQ